MFSQRPAETRRDQQEEFHDIEGPHEPEEYIRWTRSTYLNGEEADICGVEVTWQQNLTFLPGFLSNIRTCTTYTYTQSYVDIGRRAYRDSANELSATVRYRFANNFIV